GLAVIAAAVLLVVWKWGIDLQSFRKRLASNSVTLVLLLLLGAFLVWPIVLTIKGGLQAADGTWTLDHVRAVFRDPLSRAGLVNAFWIAVCTTLLSLLIALPLA